MGTTGILKFTEKFFTVCSDLHVQFTQVKILRHNHMLLMFTIKNILGMSEITFLKDQLSNVAF